jgi:hypothetical protein
MSREKARQPKCHSALSQQDQNSSEIADICELHTKKCRTQSMLHKTRRARAESPDRTPVQRVERVEKGWGDVRSSTGKRGTATHDLHHMEMPAPQNLSHRNMQERTPKIPHRHNRKNEERKDSPIKDSPIKQLLTSTAVCGPGGREQRSRRERTDIGTVVLEGKPRVVVLIVLRLGLRRAFVRGVTILMLGCWW